MKDTAVISSADRTASSTGTKQPSSGKCRHTHFLLCSLTVAQVTIIVLFFVWTIKACYIRSHRVYIVTAVDSSGLDPRYQSIRNTSIKGNITNQHQHYHHHHLHGNHSNITTNLVKDTQLEWKAVMNNKSGLITNTKQNIRIVGTTNIESLAFTLNWLESLKRLNLDYDVTFITEDEQAYEILSRRKRNSKKFDKTRLIAGRRSEGARVAGLSSVDCDVVLDILESGVDVVRIAADSVWLKDPLPLLWQRNDQCDLWITFGAIKTQSLSLAFLKASPNVISYVKALKEQLKNSPSHVLSELMAMKLGIIMLQFHVRLCYLRDDHFPSEQHVFQDEGWYAAHKGGIYVVRTGAIGDITQKRYLLQMNNLWYLRKPIDII